MMKILIAIDSFKESLSSMEAGQAIKEAAVSAIDGADVTVVPIADGGEGTVTALSNRSDAQIVNVKVTGPLFDSVSAQYCIIREKETAIIEIASAAGINLVPDKKRNPLYTTTYGVGEMIKDAIKKGCRKFIIGVGGSATNDGGIGMLGALGYSFLDEENKPIPLCAYGLKTLHSISEDNVIKELKDCSFRIACDVKNPLFGRNGCSYIFGPQKGASQEDILKMDDWLKKYSDCAGIAHNADANYPGSGAAGGLGFAFRTFLNAKLDSGIDIILDEINIEKEIQSADIVITGEGKLDAQTVMGKAPIGVAKIAKKYGKTVLAFSGCVSNGATVCNDHGIDAYFPILRTITTLDEALSFETAYNNLKNTAYQVFRLIDTIGRKI